MISQGLLLIFVVGSLAQSEQICTAALCANPYPCDGGRVVKSGCCSVCIKKTEIDCAKVKCASPYPCDGGRVVKFGCCSVCIKKTEIDCATVLCANPFPCVDGHVVKTGSCCYGCVKTPKLDCATVKCVSPYPCGGRVIKNGCCSTCVENITFVQRSGNCPPDECLKVKCGVRQEQCTGPDQYIKEGAGYCGCCNACITLVDIGGDCSDSTKECKPGSQCNPATNLCE